MNQICKLKKELWELWLKNTINFNLPKVANEIYQTLNIVGKKRFLQWKKGKFDWYVCISLLHRDLRAEGIDNEGKYGHFFTVSMSAPARRAALTAFSSFLAAALGAFLRITTGSQSCEIGPIPAISFLCICCFCVH